MAIFTKRESLIPPSQKVDARRKAWKYNYQDHLNLDDHNVAIVRRARQILAADP